MPNYWKICTQLWMRMHERHAATAHVNVFDLLSLTNNFTSSEVWMIFRWRSCCPLWTELHSTNLLAGIRIARISINVNAKKTVGVDTRDKKTRPFAFPMWYVTGQAKWKKTRCEYKVWTKKLFKIQIKNRSPLFIGYIISGAEFDKFNGLLLIMSLSTHLSSCKMCMRSFCVARLQETASHKVLHQTMTRGCFEISDQ